MNIDIHVQLYIHCIYIELHIFCCSIVHLQEYSVFHFFPLVHIIKVISSVHGLSMKELKNQLKKESCYTTILTTARIRGVEKIRLTYPDMPDADPEVCVCVCVCVSSMSVLFICVCVCVCVNVFMSVGITMYCLVSDVQSLEGLNVNANPTS